MRARGVMEAMLDAVASVQAAARGEVAAPMVYAAGTLEEVMMEESPVTPPPTDVYWPWCAVWSPADDKFFYWHKNTGDSTWTKPPVVSRPWLAAWDGDAATGCMLPKGGAFVGLLLTRGASMNALS